MITACGEACLYSDKPVSNSAIMTEIETETERQRAQLEILGADN